MAKKTLAKKNPQTPAPTGAEALYSSVAAILQEARNKSYRAVNFAMTQAYWRIGQAIVEEEQRGQERADYGAFLIANLAQRLTKDFGKGFTKNNLWYMRQFYSTYHDEPKLSPLVRELSWTHNLAILSQQAVRHGGR